MPTEAWRGNARNGLAREVFELCQQRIEDFRRSRPPMPLVVLHAEGPVPDGTAPGEPDAAVRELVNLIHEAQAQRGMLVLRLSGAEPAPPDGDGPVPDADETEYARAVEMLKALSQRPWANQKRSQYRGFSFPRSRLVLAIEQATDAVIPPGSGTGGLAGGLLSQEEFEQRLVGELKKMRWRPRGGSSDPAPSGGQGTGVSRLWSALRDFERQLRDTAGLPGALLLVALGAILSQIGGVLAGALTLAMVVAVLIVVLGFRLAPSPLWLRASGKWFATTTSLSAYATPRAFARWSRWRYANSWEVIEVRACAVGQRFLAARPGEGDPVEREKARQFHRELLAIALLEDLRDNFRSRTLDLRGRKRTVPPVVSLPNATRANGGELLVRTLSDVRSRRSEQDPLLLVAGIPAAEADGFWSSGQPTPRPDPDSDGTGPEPEALYDQWKMDLSVGQSPRLSTLAWVLRIPLDSARLIGHRSQSVSVTKVRSTWVRRAWSLRALIVVMVCLIATGLWVDQRRADEYCHGGLLGTNVDTAWARDASGARECVGVATGGVRFAAYTPDGGPTLAGLGAGTSLADIENAVREENASVGAAPYVTVVYAGPFSTSVTGNDQLVKGQEELTGVYLAQRVINQTYPVKLKVLVANGGDDMRYEDAMVTRVIALARRDPSIVGVVGLGRDTTFSDGSAARLQRAGLPIVDTTNSGTYLALRYSDYFGLAATDQEQARVLGLIAKQVAGAPGSRTAVVLSRRTEMNDHDRYTQEQRTYGRQMLQQAGFRLLADEEYSLTSSRGDANLTDPVTALCNAGPAPDAMYFAGRVEDLGGLMQLLRTTPGCANRSITIFTGDDLSKADFLQRNTNVAPKVTLYYVSLAPMDKGGGMADLGTAAQEAFQALHPDGKVPDLRQPAYTDPLFESGQVALAHDATEALYQAASRHGIPQTAAETWANLRGVAVDNMATGTITFAVTEPYAPQEVHGIDILRVSYPKDSSPGYQTTIVCGQAAGGPDRLTAAQCRP